MKWYEGVWLSGHNRQVGFTVVFIGMKAILLFDYELEWQGCE